MGKFAAIILAAGFSRRFGETDKLSADLRGAPLLSHAIAAVAASKVAYRRIVVAPGRQALVDACGLAPEELVINPNAADGMGASIAAGIAAIAEDASLDGAIVALGDMPDVAPTTIDRVIAAAADGAVAAPTYQGQRGHPVAFPRVLFPALSTLSGDAGARDLVRAAEPPARFVAVDDPGVVRDVDTPEDLTAN